MIQLTKETLLRDGQYRFSLVVGYVFVFVGIFFSYVTLCEFLSHGNLDRITDWFTLVFILAFIWFVAIFWGIKVVVNTGKVINNIKTGKITILQKQIVDIEVISSIAYDRNCRLELDDGSYIMVTRRVQRNLKIGNLCYVIYIGKVNEIEFIYNTNQYELSDEIDYLLEE